MTQSKHMRIAVDGAVLLVAAAVLLLLNQYVVGTRQLPAPGPEGGPEIRRVSSQRDVYRVYESVGLHGAHIVHLNRFLNMVDYFPPETKKPTAFPLRVEDPAAGFERGLDPHNWLFVAGRLGMVRTVTIVMPEQVFRERKEQYLRDPEFRPRNSTIAGNSLDMPFLITTLDSLPVVPEPVAVDVDAGFFAGQADPKAAAQMLMRKCRDMRLVVLVDSADEADITADMRARLVRFGELLRSGQ